MKLLGLWRSLTIVLSLGWWCDCQFWFGLRGGQGRPQNRDLNLDYLADEMNLREKR